MSEHQPIPEEETKHAGSPLTLEQQNIVSRPASLKDIPAPKITPAIKGEPAIKGQPVSGVETANSVPLRPASLKDIPAPRITSAIKGQPVLQEQQSETKPSTPTVAELQERLTTLGVEPDESPTSLSTTAKNK